MQNSVPKSPFEQPQKQQEQEKEEVLDFSKAIIPSQFMRHYKKWGLTDPADVQSAPAGTKGAYFFPGVKTQVVLQFGEKIDAEYGLMCTGYPVNPKKPKGVKANPDDPVKDGEGKLLLSPVMVKKDIQEMILGIQEHVLDFVHAKMNDPSAWKKWVPGTPSPSAKFEPPSRNEVDKFMYNKIWNDAYVPPEDKKNEKNIEYSPTFKAKIRVPTQNEQDKILPLIKKLRGNSKGYKSYEELANGISDKKERESFLKLLNSYTKWYLCEGKGTDGRLKLVDMGLEWTRIRHVFKNYPLIIPRANVGVYWATKFGPSITFSEVFVFPRKDGGPKPSIRNEENVDIVDGMDVEEPETQTTTQIPAPTQKIQKSQTAPPQAVQQQYQPQSPFAQAPNHGHVIDVPPVEDDDDDDPMGDP